MPAAITHATKLCRPSPGFKVTVQGAGRTLSWWLGGSDTRAAAVWTALITWISNQLLSPGLSIWNLSPALNSL